MTSRCVVAALLLLSGSLAAQTPAITISSATLTIDPQNSDAYTLRGNFSGLSFATAQTIVLAVGQFSGFISKSDLVQQPGTNIYSYQDPTGLAQSWFSSLTLDLDAQTFTAQANGIVLAALANPFAVQLAADGVSACTMARVQATGPVTWQLTPGDGVLEPCNIPLQPLAGPPTVLQNTTTSVTFQVRIQATPNLDPTTVQIFKADPNGQPMGSPLCTLQDNGAASNGDDVAADGIYSCIANFNESNLGIIPLLLQANAAPNLLLSPGFNVLVVQPPAQSDTDAFINVSQAVSSTWDANYTTYGDSAEARIATLSAVRSPMMPGVAKVGLLDDGQSIGVLLTSGVTYTLLLNQLDDSQLAAQPTSNIRARTAGNRGLAIGSQRGTASAAPKSVRAADTQPLSCGSPQRPVLKNNQVIVWKSTFFPEPTIATILADQFSAIGCPNFQVDQVDATMANVMNFPQYGTVILDSHGGVRDGDFELATDDPADRVTLAANFDLFSQGLIGISGIPLTNPNTGHLYYPTFFTLKSKFFKMLPPFQNTLTFASTCWSAWGGILPSILGANGGAFYGFTDSIKGTTTKGGNTIPGFSERIGPPLFTQLLSNYSNVTDAYSSVDHEPLPSEILADPTLTKGIFKAPSVPFEPPPGLPLAPQIPTFVLVTGNPGVAYLGNPQITAAGYTQPYFLPLFSRLDLQTQLDGASSCNGVMNLNWINTATGGHLTPDTGSGQDNFTNTSQSATYASLGIPPPQGGLPTDTITVNFLPDPSNPPFAQACATVTAVSDQILHVVFDGQGHSDYTTNGCITPVCAANYTGMADLNWHEAWDVHIPRFQDAQPLDLGDTFAYLSPALPETTVTGTTSASLPLTGLNCQGPPVFGGITQAPYMGVGAVPAGSNIPFPIVPMFVETFGGGLYHLCDGGQVIEIGDQVPGYPGWDSGPGLFLFNLDLRQFLGKATTVTMAVNGQFQPAPDDTNTGSVTYSGMLTFSTTGPQANLKKPAK